MNLFDLVLGDQNKGTISQMAEQFGLTEDQTRSAVGELLPSLQRGMQHNTGQEKGLNELLAAIEKGKHERYVNEPNILQNQQTTDDGNSILGHIFGNKDVSRNVAASASKSSGISNSILKKMLPVVASVVMGTISKQVFGGSSSGRRAVSNQSRGIVASMLDSDNDGSVIDDILGIAFKMIR